MYFARRQKYLQLSAAAGGRGRRRQADWAETADHNMAKQDEALPVCLHFAQHSEETAAWGSEPIKPWS